MAFSLLKNNNHTKAVLALENGSLFYGRAFGWIEEEKVVTGEIVFNTAMFGYQEIITDPSYAGQFITFTTPHIGNVGCNNDDIESEKIWASGIVVREYSPPSNYRSEQSLDEFLRKHKVMGIAGVETREVVKQIREKGAMRAALSAGSLLSESDLISAARSSPSMEGQDLVCKVSTEEVYPWLEGSWDPAVQSYKTLKPEKLLLMPHLVVIDCGVKRNILRLLVSAGFKVTVVPAKCTFEEISSLKPDAIFLSNGPGDPAAVSYVVDTVKKFLGKKPVAGICLGHQILALALGGKTYKLKFGHHGANHPVAEKGRSKVDITVQNHGFAVDEKSLPAEVEVTHINLNDGTVEGIEEPGLNVFSLQYHPEASSGPHDSEWFFKEFFKRTVYSNG
ncbi:MAG: carbamoyl-phosphate synthase small subunit [Candidatus Dadabacteria bacterium]|nr:MAG: carbamoyl-phosphate synthase small subunit [Candidatus Dadabacteria bacterium]